MNKYTKIREMVQAVSVLSRDMDFILSARPVRFAAFDLVEYTKALRDTARTIDDILIKSRMN